MVEKQLFENANDFEKFQNEIDKKMNGLSRYFGAGPKKYPAVVMWRFGEYQGYRTVDFVGFVFLDDFGPKNDA